MSLENVFEKASIDFPRDVGLNTAEKLLNYITDELNLQFDYFLSQQKTLGKSSNGENSLKTYSSGLSGDVSRMGEPFCAYKFNFLLASGNPAKFSGLQFNIAEWCDELGPTEVVKQLWADTEKTVEKYFNQDSKKNLSQNSKKIYYSVQ